MATRRERVLLELQDDFSAPMLKVASATALAKRELKDLSGTAVRGVSRDLDNASKSADKTAKSVDEVGKSTNRAGKSIDQFSGRLRLLTEAAVVLGPALVPIGAAAVPAVTALAAGLGAAAGAAGVAVLALNGVGDALDAIDAAQLEPTTENLQAMRDALDNLGPAGAQFARFIDGLEPSLQSLQDAAREGLLPGVRDGIEELLPLLPQVRDIVSSIATKMGDLSREAGQSLSGDGFAAFFDYVKTDAAPTLEAFAHATGNVIKGFGNIMVAFAPLTRDFTGGMEKMAASFAKWTEGLTASSGFQNFVEYVREAGPKVVDLIGSLANAIAGIVSAAAPLGQALLPVLSGLADVLAAIANSPIGPPLFTAAAAMLALNRATALAEASMARFGASSATAAAGAGKVGAALQVAALALGGFLVVDSVQKQFEGLSTTTGELSTQLIALSNSGAGAKLSGEFSDLGDAFERLADPNAAQAFQDKINGWIGTSDSRFDEATAKVDALDAALTKIAQNQGIDQAKASFQALAQSMGLSKDETAKLLGMLPQFQAAQKAAAAGSDRYAGSIRKVADAAGNTRAQLRGLISAMEQQKEAALNAFSAETQWRQALKDAAAQAKKNTAGINGSSKAALNNRQALEQLAGAWNNQSRAVKNSEARYQQARSALIQTATQMGVSRAQAEKLADSILDIPKSHVTQINLTGSDKALNDLYAIRQAAASIPRSISTTYYVNQVNRINRPPAPGAPGGEYADGGYTGAGGKYEPAGIVHRGEVVLPQEVVRRDWSMLRSRYGYLPGFAGGGVVGSRSFTTLDGADAVQRAAADLAAGFERVGGTLRDEVKNRKKALEIQARLMGREVERDKKRHDAMVQELKDLKDQRAQLMASTRSAFTTDIFGGNLDLEQAVKNGGLGPNFIGDLMKWLRDNNVEMQPGTMVSDYAGQYLSTLSPEQIAQLQVQAGLGQLNQDARNADAFEQALKKAKKNGLSGGLLRELENSHNLQSALMFANMSPDQIDQYQQSYRRRQREVEQTARFVGNDQYGAAIKAQTKAAERSNEALERAEKHAREMNQRLAALERQMAHLNSTQDKAPQRTGQAVGQAINGAITHGQRSGK